MSTTLKRIVGMTLGTALFLLALLFAELAGPAEAQQGNMASLKDDPTTTRTVVVQPGDSLWKITSERLGPQATLQQIDREVERTYAFNRNRIGPNPNLTFPGQKLLLPPTGKPQTPEPAPARTTRYQEAQKAGEQTGTSKEAAKGIVTSKSEPKQDSSLTAAEAAGKVGQAAKPANEPAADPAAKPTAKPVALPNMPAKQDTPKATKVGSPSATDAPAPVESLGKSTRSLRSSATSALAGLFPQEENPLLGRRLLGIAILALTLIVATLMVWKLHMKRDVGMWDVWGVYSSNSPYDRYSQELDAPEGAPSGPASVAHTTAVEPRTSSAQVRSSNKAGHSGLEEIAQAKRESNYRKRMRQLSRPPARKGLARSQADRRARRSRLPVNFKAKKREEGR